MSYIRRASIFKRKKMKGRGRAAVIEEKRRVVGRKRSVTWGEAISAELGKKQRPSCGISGEVGEGGEGGVKGGKLGLGTWSCRRIPGEDERQLQRRA